VTPEMSDPTHPGPAASFPVRVVQRTHAAQPVYLLDVTAVRGLRTRADGALWDGVLNATPDDDTDGPSPIEALMAALAGCLIRNTASMAESAHIAIDRVELHIAATRSDDPPVITSLVVAAALTSDAPFERVRHVVELALRYGTITRTLAQACPLVIDLTINGAPAALDVPALLAAAPEGSG